MVLNYTGFNGRVDVCDLLAAGSVSAGVVAYNAPDKWAAVTFEAARPVAPRAARLADGRTFPVTAGPDGLKVELISKQDATNPLHIPTPSRR